MSDRPMTWIMIARAGENDPEGSNAQARIAMFSKPTDEDVAKTTEQIQIAYEKAFGEKPERYGVAVLPYFEDLDKMGEDDE